MKKLAISLLVALCLTAHGADPYIPISCNIEKSDNQFHVRSSVLNTPVIKATIYQGTNLFNLSGWGGTFKFAKDDSQASMTPIVGSVSTSETGVIEFAVATNDFSKPIDSWYAVVLLTNATKQVSYARGLITLQRSPEISAGSALPTSVALYGPSYSVLGGFGGWAFVIKPTNTAVSG
jgi:hypothetical protein